jgi:hypothetical protein
MYTDVAKNLNNFKIELPKTIVPTPTDTDYQYGFIRRYFCQKVNDSNGHVFEISEELSNTLSNSPFWKVIDIKWRIHGPINETYNDMGISNDIGVRSSNKSAIGSATNHIKNIPLYLPNLLQFHK